MSTMTDGTPPADGRWLVFHLAGQRYAAPLASVGEVIRDGEVTPVPGNSATLKQPFKCTGTSVPRRC